MNAAQVGLLVPPVTDSEARICVVASFKTELNIQSTILKIVVFHYILSLSNEKRVSVFTFLIFYH